MSDQRNGGIKWTDETWNPIRGCSRVSKGCEHCYAETVAARFSGPGQPYEGLALRKNGKAAWTGDVAFVADHLSDPLRWKRPRRVFVNSMSDLFHEKLTNEQIAAVFGVMAAAPQHTFQVLTKRPARMVEWFKWVTEVATDEGSGRFVYQAEACRRSALDLAPNNKRDDGSWSPSVHALLGCDQRWPLPNVWLGVSAENQATADERVPLLLKTPAAVRFVSAEPLLGPIDFARIRIPDAPFPPWKGNAIHEYRGFKNALDWVIVGGESGPGARPCDVGWIRSIAKQCEEAGTACFVKQLGAESRDSGLRDVTCNGKRHYTRPAGDAALVEAEKTPGYSVTEHKVVLKDRKGGDTSEWPSDLRVQQWPEVRT